MQPCFINKKKRPVFITSVVNKPNLKKLKIPLQNKLLTPNYETCDANCVLFFMKRRVTTQINIGFYNFILNLRYLFIRSSEWRLGSNPWRVACLSQLHTYVSYTAFVHDETSRLVHRAIIKEPVYTTRQQSLHNGAQQPFPDAAVYTKLTEMHTAPCNRAAYSTLSETLQTERLCVAAGPFVSITYPSHGRI